MLIDVGKRDALILRNNVAQLLAYREVSPESIRDDEPAVVGVRLKHRNPLPLPLPSPEPRLAGIRKLSRGATR